MWQSADCWQVALANFPGQISVHYPSNKFIQFTNRHGFIFPKVIVAAPISGPHTVFTDGSSSGYAGYYLQTGNRVQNTCYNSAQRAELWAILMVFTDYPIQALNIYSDSNYVVHVVKLIETATLGHTNSEELFQLFVQLQQLIRAHVQPCFIAHLRAHNNLPVL